MASKTKVYLVLEFVNGGELFDKIVRQTCDDLLHLVVVILVGVIPSQLQGSTIFRFIAVSWKRMKQGDTFNNSLMLWTSVTVGEFITETWRCIFCIVSDFYFSVLHLHLQDSMTHPICPCDNAFICCQPENLLLDSQGNLKVSDFGLSALSQQVHVRLPVDFSNWTVPHIPRKCTLNLFFVDNYNFFCWLVAKRHESLDLDGYCHLQWMAASHLAKTGEEKIFEKKLLSW